MSKQTARRLPLRNCRQDDMFIRDQMTQTNAVSLQSYMEKFEDEIRLITCMAERRHVDALKLVNEILEMYSHPIEDIFKYKLLRLECYLHLLMFAEAREEGPALMDTSTNEMQVNEHEIASIAYKCRNNSDFVRAMLYYQCSLRCWLRDMRIGKIKKRSIEVINRAEKFALMVYHIGLSADTKGMVYEYALQVYRQFVEDYEGGPEQLSVHRDVAIMGCCYFIGVTLRKLNDPTQSLNFTSHGINIGMKSMKEHKNYLLAKSHLLAAQCYLDLSDRENAEMWLEVALKICPFITNWDFQSPTETKKDFEEEVTNYLKAMKLSDSTTFERMKK